MSPSQNWILTGVLVIALCVFIGGNIAFDGFASVGPPSARAGETSDKFIVAALRNDSLVARKLLANCEARLVPRTPFATPSPAVSPSGSPVPCPSAPSCPAAEVCPSRAPVPSCPTVPPTTNAGRLGPASNGTASSGPYLDVLSALYTPAGMDPLAVHRLPEEGLAPLTRWAQQYIFDHQNRRTSGGCATAKYLRHTDFNSGMGSMLHVSTYHLALAVASNRVFVWSENAGSYNLRQQSVCVGRGDTSWTCLLRPPSDCGAPPPGADVFSLSYMLGSMQWGTMPSEDIAAIPGSADHEMFVPRVFVDALRALAPDMSPSAMKYWWRAQAVAYLLRFNDHTINGIWELRQRGEATVNSRSGISGDSKGGAPPLLPLPRGTISAHVRHGDKGVEMSLVPWKGYADAAARLLLMHPLSLRHVLFVSSEDPSVIDDAENSSAPWMALHTTMPRENSNGHDQMRLAGNLVYYHFLQLLMALEADAWVGTRGSNWNRLIDELRCVWVAKCNYPFMEVGQDHDWKGFGW